MTKKVSYLIVLFFFAGFFFSSCQTVKLLDIYQFPKKVNDYETLVAFVFEDFSLKSSRVPDVFYWPLVLELYDDNGTQQELYLLKKFETVNSFQRRDETFVFYPDSFDSKLYSQFIHYKIEKEKRFFHIFLFRNILDDGVYKIKNVFSGKYRRKPSGSSFSYNAYLNINFNKLKNSELNVKLGELSLYPFMLKRQESGRIDYKAILKQDVELFRELAKEFENSRQWIRY